MKIIHSYPSLTFQWVKVIFLLSYMLPKYIFFLLFFFHFVKALLGYDSHILQLTHSKYMLSHFSHVRLCATPWTAAHQASPSLGFSRQEHQSGLPSPSPATCINKYKLEMAEGSEKIEVRDQDHKNIFGILVLLSSPVYYFAISVFFPYNNNC